MVLDKLAMIDVLGRPFYVCAAEGIPTVAPADPAWCTLLWLIGPTSSVQGPEGLWHRGPRLLCFGPSQTPTPLVTQGNVLAVEFHPGEVNETFFDHDVYEEPVPRRALNDRYLLEPFLNPVPPSDAGLSIDPSQVARLHHLFSAVRAELSDKRDGYWPCRTRSYLLELLIQVRHLKSYAPPPTLAERLEAHLHTHYAQTLRIDELAHELGTNRTTLSGQFKTHCGMTIVTYVNRLRMQVAATLLRDTTLPLAEILERVGVHDQSRFGRLFKAHWGVPPGEYQRSENWIFPHLG